MKKLSFILVSVLLLIFFSLSVIAQSQKGLENRSIVTEETWTGYNQPVWCAGNSAADPDDYLIGTAFLHAVYHLKDGEVIKRNVIMRGEATSDITGEVFKIKEQDVENWDDFWVDGIMHWRFNLKGNMGSHYIGYYTLTLPGWVITVEKILCK
jgi:hypothetical protein